MILKAIQDQTDVTEQIRLIDEFFLLHLRPKSFHGANGFEVQSIKNFEETCILLVNNRMTTDPKNMTVLSFFQALEVIREQARKEKASRGKIKAR